MNKLFLIKLGVLFFLITIVMIFVGKSLGISPHDVKHMVNSFGIYAPVAYSIMLFLGLSVPFNPISDFLVINIAALLFPPHISVFFTFIAHVCSIAVNYYVAKKFGRKLINSFTQKDKSNTIIQFSKKLTYTRLFLLRFVLPTSNLIGSDILSYLSGIQKMNFPKYFLLSIIPWTILNILYFYATSLLIKNWHLIFFLPLLIILGFPAVFFIVKKSNILKK